jgi:signal transduction histidine kinase
MIDDRQKFLFALKRSKTMSSLSDDKPGGMTAGWTFVILYDMDTFLGPQDTLIWLTILIASGLILILMLFATLTSQYLTRPLRILSHQAEQLAVGELDVQASVDSHDEIGELAESFNQMAYQLRLTYRKLEDRAQENRLRAEHISAINRLINAIFQVRSVDELFEIIREGMTSLFRFDGLWISLWVDEKDLRISHIEPTGLISIFDRGRIPLRWSLHGQVYRDQKAVHAEIGPDHQEEYFETRIFNSEGFRSWLIAPLPGREKNIGTLTGVSGSVDAFNNELSIILTSLARGIAVAVEQIGLIQRLSQFASELEMRVEERTSELERAMQKLVQTEKYFATGRLAGNIAHEINNPLGIIKNYLQLVRNKIGDAGGGRRSSDPNLAHLRIIDEEVNRIARLVRHMKDLHRPVEDKVESVNIHKVLEGILFKISGEHAINGKDPDMPIRLAIRSQDDSMGASGRCCGGS